jgi:prophage regulatory protein
MPQQFLRLPQLQDRVPLSRASIYQKMKDGDFPAAIPIGPHAVAWLASDVDEWIDEQVRSARGERAEP